MGNEMAEQQTSWWPGNSYNIQGLGGCYSGLIPNLNKVTEEY